MRKGLYKKTSIIEDYNILLKGSKFVHEKN